MELVTGVLKTRLILVLVAVVFVLSRMVSDGPAFETIHFTESGPLFCNDSSTALLKQGSIITAARSKYFFIVDFFFSRLAFGKAARARQSNGLFHMLKQACGPAGNVPLSVEVTICNIAIYDATRASNPSEINSNPATLFSNASRCRLRSSPPA